MTGAEESPSGPAPAATRPGMSSPRQVRKLYAFLTASDYCAEFLFGITGTLYFLDRGLNPAGIGLMLAFFWWAEALFEIPSGIVADMIGRKPTILAGYVTRAGGYLLVAVLPDLTVGIVGFVIVGLGSTLTSGAAEAWGIDEIESAGGRPADLDRFFSISKAAENTGMVLGSVAGGLIGSVSLAAPFYLTAVFFAVTTVIAAAAMRESRPADRGAVRTARGVWRAFRGVVTEASSVLRGDRRLPVLMAASAVPRMLGAAPGIQWNVYLSTFVGSHLVYLGATRSAAYFCALLAAAALVPLMARGVSRRTIVGLGSVVGGGGLLLAAQLPGLAVATFGYVLYTTSRSAVEPGVMAAITERGGSAARATVISCYTAAAGLAYGIGYLVFGALIKDLASVTVSWTVTGLLTAATAVPLVLLIAPAKNTSPPPVEPLAAKQDGRS